jgi:predicted metalloprotease with PDZ domain
MIRCPGVLFALWLTAMATPGLAQCRFPATAKGRVLTYTFDPTVTEAGTVLHVNLKLQGGSSAQENIEVPVEWAGETLHGVTNIRAVSAGAVVADTASPARKTVRHPPNQEVVLTYDVVKDWTGRFRHPAEFHGALMPEYIELNGENALVKPVLAASARVTVRFDWQKLPASWVLATSFGTSSEPVGRCQSYSGAWSGVAQALFAAGDFRVHRFQIGGRPAVLAVRGEWTFSDEEVVADIQKSVGVVRDFWHDHNSPYFLVTLKPFDNDSGDGDGSQFTDAYWLYLSRRDSISDQLPVLVHETFHAWNPRRMGDASSEENAIEWFREGFTTYYGYLLAYRAGLIDLPEYVENVNRDLRDSAGSGNAYVRGRLIALWLDREIRKDSGGKRSLDQVMYDMVRGAPRPLTQARILETADRYLSPASRNELAQAVKPGSLIPTLEDSLGRCVRGSTVEVASKSSAACGNFPPSQPGRCSMDATISRTISAVIRRPSLSFAPWRSHCQTCVREISAVAASSIRL